MSRSPEGKGSRRDGGFSLIEVIVALGILSTVLVAILPQLVTGIRATDLARGVSQAKGVAQGQLERMRSLPFHIARDAGPFRDVLDYYYTNTTGAAAPTCTNAAGYVAPTTASTGYVAAGSTRCSYEPGSGAFYRVVSNVAAAPGLQGYTMVVDTQFLSGATPPVPVTPSAGYNSQTTGADSPAASQIGVTVTVLQLRRGTLRPVTTYTQIAKRLPSTNRVRAEADVRAVDLGSVTADRVPLSLSAGMVSLTGAVSFASTAAANLAATSASLASGDNSSGASATLSAPPARSAATATRSAGGLATGGCALACWGATTLRAPAMAAVDAAPTVGSATDPAQVLLADGANDVLSFGNTAAATGYRPDLKLSLPLVRMDTTAAKVGSELAGCGVSSSGTGAYVSASGYVTTAATPAVDSCVVARTTPIELFPTTFAPHGVVRVELTRASVRCQVQGSSHTPTATTDFSAVVSYWNGAGYTVAATVLPNQSTDQLDAVPLSTSVGDGMTLGDYVSSWSGLTSSQVVTVAASGRAQLKLPGIVKIVSQPVRTDATSLTGENDETSAVSVTVGALSCKAEDAR